MLVDIERTGDDAEGTETYRVFLDLLWGKDSRLRSDPVSRERAEELQAELVRRITIIAHEHAGGKGDYRERGGRLK